MEQTSAEARAPRHVSRLMDRERGDRAAHRIRSRSPRDRRVATSLAFNDMSINDENARPDFSSDLPASVNNLLFLLGDDLSPHASIDV